MIKYTQFERTYMNEDDEGETLTINIYIDAGAPEGTYVMRSVLEDAAESAADKIFDEGFHLE